jgi:DNA excision repair protein ERCC-2
LSLHRQNQAQSGLLHTFFCPLSSPRSVAGSLADSQPSMTDTLSPASPPTGWTHTVAVRALCDFTAKQGDLDRRFTPSATALEGLLGQAAVVARRTPDYESEIALEGQQGLLRVRGRADGYDPQTKCLEEIKTIRGHPDDVPANRKRLHWAQLETYGALWCRSRGVAELQLALVYVDTATQEEVVLRQTLSAAHLDTLFTDRCAAYADWAEQEAKHRAARDEALANLSFPPGAFRPGQRDLSETVYRTTLHARCLLAQAPTGIGKTIGVMYPLLRAVPTRGIDKIAYLTCKGTGRQTALEALHQLRQATPHHALRVLTMVAKDQACEHPDKACHPEACPLAEGFFDRLPAARSQAVQAGWMDARTVRELALGHGICPYYLGHALLPWADVLVGDVNHAFDPNGALISLAQAQDWRLSLAIDEAHNLVERTRHMHSATLSLHHLREVSALAPKALRSPLARLLRCAEDLAQAQRAPYTALQNLPDELSETLTMLNASLGDYFQDRPTATGALLDFYFDMLAFERAADTFGPHAIFDVVRNDKVPLHAPDSLAIAPQPEADLTIRNVVPAPYLRPRFAACHSVTLFSATLEPQAYQRDLLGLPETTVWLDVPPAFEPEHLQVRVAHHVSTRYADRARSLDAVVDVLAQQHAQAPGNYLAFFSSFDYLDQAANRLLARHPQLPAWRQSRAMDETSRLQFLARFVPDGQGIGFAVLGGAFAEGIDLPGTRLIGAFIATLGLPPISPMQDEIRGRLDAMFGADHGYADLVPGMQKVVQAAGRVLRSPQDRGWLWLMDDRYARTEVRALLPGWWLFDQSV